MAISDKALLDIHPIDEELSDSPSIAVSGDPTNPNLSTFYKPAEMVMSCPSRDSFCSAAFELGSVDTGEPDPLSSGRPARVSINAVVDDRRLKGFRSSRREH